MFQSPAYLCLQSRPAACPLLQALATRSGTDTTSTLPSKFARDLGEVPSSVPNDHIGDPPFVDYLHNAVLKLICTGSVGVVATVTTS